MNNRKPLTINGRTFVYPEFQATVVRFPKSKEKPSIVSWKQAGNPVDGSVGGGRVVGK